jgi:O-antigen/teichoic acid export membrane protein
MMMVSGEAMQSGFHFALNLVLIHMLPAKDYGIFAIVMVIGGLSLTYIRSFTALPASIAISRSQSGNAADVHELTFGSAALLLSAIIGIGVAMLLYLWFDSGAIAGGCFVALWSLRSHMRIAFFARQWQQNVSFSDLAFTITGFAGLLFVTMHPGGNLLFWIFLLMTAANGLGIAMMLILPRRRQRLSYSAAVRRRYARLWRQIGWAVLSVTTTNLQGQSVALLVTAIGGPEAYAPIATVLTLFVPLRVALIAITNMVQPEAADLLARNETARLSRLCRNWSLVAGAFGFAYGFGVFAILPFFKVATLESAHVTLLGFFAWVIVTCTMLYVMPRLVLEAGMAFRTVSVITAVGAAVGLLAICLFLWAAPPSWALGGGAISEIVVTIGYWWYARGLLGDRHPHAAYRDIDLRPRPAEG